MQRELLHLDELEERPAGPAVQKTATATAPPVDYRRGDDQSIPDLNGPPWQFAKGPTTYLTLANG